MNVTSVATKILADALALPEDERRRVAELLLDSVSTDTTEEIRAAWAAEAIRRAEALERGDSRAVDGESALAAVRARLRDTRR